MVTLAATVTLDAFNARLVGPIEVVAAYRHGERVELTPDLTPPPLA
jgi:hypothetical protein